jgi:ribulose-phosphate 3-epimerase
MASIVPTVTAFDVDEYRTQIERIQPFAERIHIDLMDGVFAPSVSPTLDSVWWPFTQQADIHLMYKTPMDYLPLLIKLQPRMVVIHNEADVHHMHFAAELHKAGIMAGLAILQDTPIDWAHQIMHSFDHVLIFSGHLGYHGGEADLGLLQKVAYVREHHPDAEIGWDGGVNAENAQALIDGGVDVLNVGGFIQKSANPNDAYATLEALIKA